MITPKDPTIYEFDNFRIDSGRRLIFNGGEGPLPLTPKAFDTLLYLVTHNNEVIRKDELISAIWPDTIVEENNLNKNISALRQLLGETPGEHRFIVTVPGKGYKFVADVREITDRPTYEPESRPEPERQESQSKWFLFVAAGVLAAVAILAFAYPYFTSQPAIHSIAVMPFVNETGNAELEYLSDGMTESLIGSLSKLPGFQVKASSSVSLQRHEH